MTNSLAPLAGALAIVSTSLLVPGTAGAQERILYNCFHPPQYYTCAKVLPEMAARIEEATEGRVKMSIPPKSLAAATEQMEGVVNGVMDAATSFTPFIASETTGLQLTVLPYIGRKDAVAASRALYRTYHTFFAGLPGEFENVELLGIYVVNGSDMWSLNDTPIMTVEDLANRKMFAVAGSAANVIKETGSAVVAGPAVQMLESISNGVVDGYAGVTWDVLEAFKTGQYTKSGTFTKRKLTQPAFAMFINKDKWGRIAPEDQEAIKAVLDEDFSAWVGGFANAQYDFAREKYSAAGVQSFDASPEFEAALVDLAKDHVEAWKARVAEMGVNGDEVIAFFEEAYTAALAEGTNN